MTIYAKDGPPKTSLAAWLEGSPFNKRRPGMLSVYLAPWTEVELTSLGDDGQPLKGGKPHDRHIRFSTWSALTTEEGFDRLKQSTVPGEDGMSLHRVIIHPSSADSATHIHNLRAKEQAIIETSLWSWLSWSIAYDLAGGHGHNPPSYTNHAGAISLVAPSRDGYTFAGWLGTDLHEPTINVSIPAGSTGRRTYTATWEVCPHPLPAYSAGGDSSQRVEPDAGRATGGLL